MVFQVISPTVDIALLALLVSVVSIVVQYKFLDRKKMNEMQKQMKENQKRMMELLKREDDKAKKELKQIEQEMNRALNEVMKNSMKGMMVAFIYLPILWALPAYADSTLPVGEVNVWLLHLPNYYAYYIISAIVFSLIANTVWTQVIDKKK